MPKPEFEKVYQRPILQPSSPPPANMALVGGKGVNVQADILINFAVEDGYDKYTFSNGIVLKTKSQQGKNNKEAEVYSSDGAPQPDDRAKIYMSDDGFINFRNIQNAIIEGTKNADKIRVLDSEAVEINTGDGDDFVVANYLENHNKCINTGNGDDTLILSNSSSTNVKMHEGGNANKKDKILIFKEAEGSWTSSGVPKSYIDTGGSIFMGQPEFGAFGHMQNYAISSDANVVAEYDWKKVNTIVDHKRD